jgi:hypothetical protein
MPGRGPAPKPTRIRPTDDKRRQSEFTALTTDGEVRGPDLPGDGWPEETLAMYDTLRRSPMAQTWLDADWRYLIDTMVLHAAYWQGEPKLAGEIRLRLGQFGVTPEARLRLRLLVDEAPPPESTLERLRARQAAQSLAPGSARRRRLMKALEAHETPTKEKA